MTAALTLQVDVKVRNFQRKYTHHERTSDQNFLPHCTCHPPWRLCRHHRFFHVFFGDERGAHSVEGAAGLRVAAGAAVFFVVLFLQLANDPDNAYTLARSRLLVGLCMVGFLAFQRIDGPPVDDRALQHDPTDGSQASDATTPLLESHHLGD